jgi:tRNA-2-methylthio-N6-dimethylallyladenosine synthase
MDDALIKVATSGGRFAPHIHLPFQSGDDKVLAAMNRKYTSKHYLSLVEKIKKANPEYSLSTDIIVGFPVRPERSLIIPLNNEKGCL